MSCVNPPLLRKPPKGFAWQCAFCSRKEIQDIDTTQSQQPSNKPTPRTTNTTSTTTSKAVAKRQTRTSARIQSQQLIPTATDKTTDTTPSQPSPPSPLLSDTKLKSSNEKGTTHVPS